MMPRTVPERPRHHGFNRMDYHRMAEAGILGEDDRVELIEGEIIDMTPIGSRHAGAVARVQTALQEAVGGQALVWVQNPVALGANSEPQPDLALLRPRHDFYAESLPQPGDVLLLIEVSDRSLAYDRDVKLPLYAAHGIPEVWLVDLDGRRLTRHWAPTSQAYGNAEAVTALDAVPLPDSAGGRLDLQGLFG